jgi:uncharacterized membrane protein
LRFNYAPSLNPPADTPHVRIRVFIALQVLALVLLGLMAGFFFAFAIDVAPAMARLDAAGYIVTQQHINSVVRNAVFGFTYFGSAVLPFLAALAAVWVGRRRIAVGWLLVAVVYFGAVFWVTRTVNVPINNELATWSATAPPTNWQNARDTWNQSNVIRTMASVLCFVGGLTLLGASAGRRRELGDPTRLGPHGKGRP